MVAKGRDVMTLYSNWKQILKKAWSIRLAAIAGLLSAAETLLPLYATSFPRGMFAALSVVVIVGAMFARLAAQKGIDNGND